MRGKRREVSGYQWFVLRVRSGREDMVERALVHRGFAAFCPQASAWRWAINRLLKSFTWPAVRICM